MCAATEGTGKGRVLGQGVCCGNKSVLFLQEGCGLQSPSAAGVAPQLGYELPPAALQKQGSKFSYWASTQLSLPGSLSRESTSWWLVTRLVLLPL